MPSKKLSPQNKTRRPVPQKTLPLVINDSEDDLENTPERKGHVEKGHSQPVGCNCRGTRAVLASESRESAYFCERCEPQGSSSIAGNNLSTKFVSSRSATGPIEERRSNETSETEDAPSPIAALEAAEAVETNATAGPRLVTAQERISDLEGEAWQLKLELEVRDTTITGLQREVSCLREAQKQRDSQAGIPLEKLMTENLDLQKTLRANLSARQDGAKFAKLTNTSREWFGNIKTNDGFYDIYSESQQILCQRDCENWEFQPSIIQHTKLQKLVSKSLAVELNTHSQAEEAMRELLKFTPDTVVRALATSALLQWVFETDFPRFDEGPSEILEEYRSLLGSQGDKSRTLMISEPLLIKDQTDGALALRNIDLAARASLTKAHAFQEKTIPDTANNLAIKLSQTLAPLFCKTPEAKDETWDGFSTWQDDKEEWTNRRKRLTDMFKAALRMKADSCLNVEDYEMVIYPPGTRFDKKTMRTEIIAGMQNKTNSHQGRVVGICIEAAVFAHARKELSPNALASDATAISHNFVCRNEGDRARIHPRVKAVVILAEE